MADKFVNKLSVLSFKLLPQIVYLKKKNCQIIKVFIESWTSFYYIHNFNYNIFFRVPRDLICTDAFGIRLGSWHFKKTFYTQIIFLVYLILHCTSRVILRLAKHLRENSWIFFFWVNFYFWKWILMSNNCNLAWKLGLNCPFKDQCSRS